MDTNTQASKARWLLSCSLQLAGSVQKGTHCIQQEVPLLLLLQEHLLLLCTGFGDSVFSVHLVLRAQLQGC